MNPADNFTAAAAATLSPSNPQVHQLPALASLAQPDMPVERAQSVSDEAPILHQPIALPPQTQGVHGPNGLLGSQASYQSGLYPQPVHAAFAQLTPQAEAVFSQVQAPNAQQPILNDALSYLDQVKGQFSDHPDVYNKFLDIMKEFKSGAIDTPGVIKRVSHLFAGNPALIQGFNTFLPPGYRIDCGYNDDPNSIRVTTPMGTTLSNLHSHGPSPGQSSMPPYNPPPPQQQWPHQHEQVAPTAVFALPQGPSEQDVHLAHEGPTSPGMALIRGAAAAAAAAAPIPPPPPSGDLVPHSSAPNSASIPPPQHMERRAPVEFNHAISYVNKIKNRFAAQPDIYKQFLEILQTYQRDSKPIQEVYGQVTRLFDSAPDLLEDFKQFLPESAAHAGSGRRHAGEDIFAMSSTRQESGYLAAAHAAQLTPRVDQQRLPPMGNFAPTPSSGKDRRKRERHNYASQLSAEPPATAGRNAYGQAANKKHKASHTSRAPATAETSLVMPSLVPPEPAPIPPVHMTSVSPEDMQMLEKIRKYINNKTIYTELLRLMNLYTQNAISSSYMLYRIQSFVGVNEEIMGWFRSLLAEEDEENRYIPMRASNARVSLSRCRAFGPSYRRLPRAEMMKPCSGRDELCKSVLNDEWVSHPTWESEESGFVAHKKTNHEEILHRVEEERHDYDSNLECLAQTIALLEIVVKQIQARPPDEQRSYRTNAKLGGRSEFIWKRTIYRLYGRDHGKNVIARLLDNTYVVAPSLLLRLREVKERWKAAQRQWNDAWRLQTLQSYHKSLDHQGTNQRTTHDKRQYQPKTLQQEIRTRLEDQREGRIDKLLDSFSKEKNASELRSAVYQYSYIFDNKEVLMDTLQLIFVQFDQKTAVDDPQIGSRMRSFFALFLSIDPAQLSVASEDDFETPPESENSFASDNGGPVRSRGSKKVKSLYQTVLDKDKPKPSTEASPSREVTPAGINEEESRSIASVHDPQTEAAALAEANTWFESNEVTILTDLIRGSKAADQARERYPMYCNSVLYCFMRLFGMLYDRLLKLYSLESEVRKLVEVQLIQKPAHELFLIDKTPRDFFDDVSSTASFYKQVLGKFELLITGHENVAQAEVEDLLRRYYLAWGFELYHIDKHVAQMDRLGVMMFGNEKDKLSEQLLKLWKQDRIKDTKSIDDDRTYLRQSAKHLAPKEKEGETAYMVNFVSVQTCNFIPSTPP